MIHHDGTFPRAAWLAVLAIAFAAPATVFAEEGGFHSNGGPAGPTLGQPASPAAAAPATPARSASETPAPGFHSNGGRAPATSASPATSARPAPATSNGESGNGDGATTRYSSGYSSAPEPTTPRPAAAPYPTNWTYEPGDGYRYQLYYAPSTGAYLYYPVAR